MDMRIRYQRLAAALWMAVLFGVVAAYIFSTLSLTEPPEPPGPALVSPVVPWFLTEGASAEWQVNRSINDSWRNGSFEMFVATVGEGEVSMVVNEPGSSYNRTFQASELLSQQTTSAALINTFHPQLIEVSVYDTEIRTHETVGRSWPVIREHTEFSHVNIGNVTSSRLVDLSHLILLEFETTTVDTKRGMEQYSIRTLVSTAGLSLLNATEVTSRSFDLPRTEFALQLFGSGVIDGIREQDVLSLDIDVDETSLVASVIRSDAFLPVEEEVFELEDLVWTLNDTHSLLAFHALPGKYR
jgi:hypothetical protein